MIEYSLFELMTIADAVVSHIRYEDFTKEQLEEVRIRLYPISNSGELHFDIGSTRPWSCPMAKN